MTLDHRLLEMLVCPICKGPLEAGRTPGGPLVELICPADRLAFPIHDGIPVMLESEARPLAAEAGAGSTSRPAIDPPSPGTAG